MTSVKTTQTFNLSEEDVQTAVSEFVEGRFGPGGKITVSVGTRTVTTGYGQSERDTQVVAISAAREPVPAEQRVTLQTSADEARADELRLATNYLHASGIKAWREAARELSDLKHRADVDPT
jgi:hypothetical protein